MKFTCLQENLARGLSIVGHLATKSVTLPILSHVLIKIDGKVIKFMTTNLEVGVSSLIRGKVDASGEFTVPAKLFTDFVSLLPNDHVECILENGSLTVSCKNVKTQLRGIAASEFPLIPSFSPVATYAIPANQLRDALTQVVFAASSSETRPEISGILFSWNGAGTLTLAATDSYRLSERQAAAQGQGGNAHDIIVPSKTAHEVLRVLGLLEEADAPVEIRVGENQIGFVAGNTEVSSRIIEGKYPDYKQIIPNELPIKAVVERTTLIRAVRSAGLFSKQGLHDVQLRCDSKNGTITVVGKDSQTGEQTIDVPATLVGGEVTATLNYRYLLDGLNAHGSEKTSLQLIDGNSPVLIRPDDPGAGFLYIVMPIRQ